VCGREGARISAGFDSDQRVLVVEDKAWQNRRAWRGVAATCQRQARPGCRAAPGDMESPHAPALAVVSPVGREQPE